MAPVWRVTFLGRADGSTDTSDTSSSTSTSTSQTVSELTVAIATHPRPSPHATPSSSGDPSTTRLSLSSTPTTNGLTVTASQVLSSPAPVGHESRRSELVDITVPSILTPLALLAVVTFLLVRRKRRGFMKAPSYQARVLGFSPQTSMRSRSQDALTVVTTTHQYTSGSHENIAQDSKMSSVAPSAMTTSAIVSPASQVTVPWYSDPPPSTPDSDRVSSHSRGPSLAERRSQRLQRALQDAPRSPMPPLTV